ncbi:hypothetical protein M513_07389 [Trichuris suis]|uniref:Chromatin modification-related protein MEAF6 n=1 Tax=Trichuris suis TaxID=68888 RepID=A0A085M397_9BILA|nr:hypothetical protein M513_07389 [Trichuris suis]
MSAVGKKDLASAFATAQQTVERARRYLQRKRQKANGENSTLASQAADDNSEIAKTDFKKRMAEFLRKRAFMEAALAEAERQVYEKEENYLAEFEHIGTVITGFQPISEFRSSTGPDSKGSRARKRRHSVTDAIRLFSWTSCTSGVEIDEAQLAAFKKKDSEGNSDNSDIEDDGAQDKNFT